MDLSLFLDAKHFRGICFSFVMCSLIMTGCAISGKSPQPVRTDKLPVESPVDLPRERADSRSAVSAALVNEGVAFLKQEALDSAIRVLERAVGLYPAQGKGYYYLAQAWILKKNNVLARHFNRLARRYLGHDLEWSDRIQTQAVEIKNMDIHKEDVGSERRWP